LTVADALALAVDDGSGNTLIDFGGGDTLTLTGVAAADLAEANFIGTDTVAATLSAAPTDLSISAETVLGAAELNADEAGAPPPVVENIFTADPFDQPFDGADAGLVSPPALTGSDLGDSL
ncbi:MAG: hypothetical protein AAGK23_13365, partial [Pseudomonadota bacterium]